MARTFLSRLEAIRGKLTRSVSLGVFLARLIWLCVVPLALLAGYLAVIHVLTLQSQQEHDAADRVCNIMITVDRYITGQIDGLQMLAASPLLDDPHHWNEYYSEAQGFRQSFGGHVVLADLSMQMIFNTRVPFGTPLPKLPVPKGRAAAPAALATGRPAVGDTFIGPVAKEAMVAVVVPVIRNGQTRYLLVSSIETRQIKRHLDEVALPAGWSLTLYDSVREVIAGRTPAETTDDSSPDETLSRFVARSAVTPWTATIEVPRSVLRSSILAAAAALSVAILLVTLVSVFGGRLAGRRLARSVAALAHTATPPASRPLIAEVEAVRRLIEESATAREAVECTLRESEQRLRQLFDAVPVPIFLANRMGEIVQTNARFHQTFGYARDEVPSLSMWWQRACPASEYRQWVVETLEAAVAHARDNHEDIEPVELRITCGDGRDLTVVTSGVVLGDDVLVTFYDITDRKLAEEALRTKEATLRGILDATKESIWQFSTDGVVLMANETALRLLGKQTGEVIGRRFDEIFPAKLAQSRMARLKEAVETGRPVEFEDERAGIIFDHSYYPVLDAEGGAVSVASFSRDMTARKRAEIELQESFQEKVALLKEVHHRVKNNLQIVASLLSLQAGRTSNPTVLDVLHDTRNRVRSMALLHEALYRAGNLAHIDFSAYVRELCTQLLLSSGRAAAGIKVESRVPALGLAMEQALPCGLIINELISNSLKHGFPEGRSGRILVELQPGGERQFILQVCDDGVGLPSDLDPSHVSTLGLKLVSNLAVQLGGKLRVEQPPGGGAAFRVTFPAPDGIEVPNGSQTGTGSRR